MESEDFPQTPPPALCSISTHPSGAFVQLTNLCLSVMIDPNHSILVGSTQLLVTHLWGWSAHFFLQLFTQHLLRARLCAGCCVHHQHSYAFATKTSPGHSRSAGSPPGSSALGKLHPGYVETWETIPNVLSEKSRSPKGCRKKRTPFLFQKRSPCLAREQMGPM